MLRAARSWDGTLRGSACLCAHLGYTQKSSQESQDSHITGSGKPLEVRLEVVWLANNLAGSKQDKATEKTAGALQ